MEGFKGKPRGTKEHNWSLVWLLLVDLKGHKPRTCWKFGDIRTCNCVKGPGRTTATDRPVPGNDSILTKPQPESHSFLLSLAAIVKPTSNWKLDMNTNHSVGYWESICNREASLVIIASVGNLHATPRIQYKPSVLTVV